jgi:hypothetical protein
MNTLPSSDSGTTLVKWQQPEKVAGYVFLAALAGVGIYAWGTIVPFLVDVIFDTVKLGIGLGILLVSYLVLSSPKVKAGFWYAGQRMFRSMAGIFVNTDPIGIMLDYIESTKAEARKLHAETGKVEASYELVKRKIETNTQQMRDLLDTAASAKRQGDTDMADTYASRAAQVEAYTTRLQPMLTTTKNVALVMRKILKVAEKQIADGEFNVGILKDEYATVKSAGSGMRAAMNILRGDPDKKYFFDLAADRVAQDMAQQLGQIKEAMRYSHDFVKEMDVQSGVMSEKGQRMLEKYQKGEFTSLGELDKVPLTVAQTRTATQDAYKNLLD